MISQTDGYKNEVEFSDEIMKTLEFEQFDMETEIDLAFYLYFNSEIHAKNSAQTLKKSGYSCDIEQSEDKEWLCYVTAQMVPSNENLQKIGQLLLNSAETHEGDLDGWEVVPDYSFSIDSIMDYSSIGNDILETLMNMYQPDHEWKEVRESDFSDFNVEFYSNAQRDLERIGFEHISDLEDLTVSAQSSIATLIRVMTHPETKSIVAFYYVPDIGMGICEFETLLSNEATIISSTSPQSYEIADTPMIVKEHYSDVESISELFRIHIESVNTVLDKHPAVKAQSINTFEDVVYMQNMQNRLKYDYMKSIGWVTKEFLIAQSNGDEATAIAVYNAIQDILENQHEINT